MTGRRPIESRLHVNGVELALFTWPGDPSLAPLLFAHATGFHARCWDGVIEALPAPLQVHPAYALDLRGHGRSEQPPLDASPSPYAWAEVGRDVAEAAAALDLRGAIGVGHSMGGHSVTLAAAQEPGRFGALLLVDPVIMPPEAYERARREGIAAPEDHFVARRRAEWASPEEMLERFAGRPPYSGWDPRILRDYCEHGLLPSPSGDGFVLACPPIVEAQFYQQAPGTDALPFVAQVDVPVRVLRAREPEPGAVFSGSPTWPGLASAFLRGEDVHLPDASHFIPMEAPELVARHAADLVAVASRS